ncbi:MAG: sulfotransferase [Actinobacteria bacterium]|nr:sulfotransferase [Actinomycetota bacterium]
MRQLRVIYIAGWGRSGSTLLENLLTRDSRATTVGESFQLWSAGSVHAKYCSCGQRLESCPVWSAIQMEMAGDWPALVAAMADRRRALRLRNLHRILRGTGGWSGQRDVDAYAETLGRLYAAAAATQGVDTVVDASKLPLVLAAAARIRGIELKVVHLVRDPRGVMHSWATPKPRQYADGYTKVMRTYSAAGSLDRWALNHSLCWYAIKAGGLDHAAVSYERLAALDEATLRSISALTGIDLTGIVDATVIVPPQHAIGGNPGRGSGDRIAIRTDERWRTEMARSHQLLGTLGLPLHAALLGRPWRSPAGRERRSGGAC